MSGIIVDIGTGDGTFVRELAATYPDRLVIGIDPNHKAMVDVSRKLNKKPEKGGLTNAFFVLARVEELPHELDDLANQVFINFPWSGLLGGIVLVDGVVWENIGRICKTGAFIDIVFGYSRNAEAQKADELSLPDIDLEYINTVMTDKLREKGFVVERVTELSKDDIKSYPSGWAKKLTFGQDRAYYYLRVKKV